MIVLVSAPCFLPLLGHESTFENFAQVDEVCLCTSNIVSHFEFDKP